MSGARPISARGCPNRSTPGADPYLGAERGEALEFAVLLLLERLSPTERAAYVLREAFDYPIPADRRHRPAQRGGGPPAGQQGPQARSRRASRARDRSRTTQAADRLRRRAARSGDLTALEELFAADVTSYSDGGGAVRASRFPVAGASRVAKYVKAFAGHFWSGVDVGWASMNGQTSALLSRDGQAFAVLTVNASEQGIDQVLWMMNPAKLTAVSIPPDAPRPAQGS
ncbi:hypothetical protein [Nonomuraea dietziae]|uniref:hypothetical protein n=1 Tax=Nonomuraea dietziae TaxID=65515 RepID=UPI0031E366FD